MNAISQQFLHNDSEEIISLLASAVKYAGDGIIITDRNGRVEFTNQAFCTLSQFHIDDVIGQAVAAVVPVVTEFSWKRKFMHAIRQNGVWHDEQWGERKDGEAYLARVTVTPVSIGDSDAIAYFVTILQDNTKHHGLEMQLIQAQKMEAVGTLAGGIAHDFNNLLSSLAGHIYMAKKQLKNIPEGPDGENETHLNLLDHFVQMETLGAHAAEMIQQLMTFARKGNVEKTVLALPIFMKEALKLAAVSLPENITFRQAIHHNQLLVCANATQLQQAIMNLVNNARDALSGVARPEISVSLDKVDAEHTSLRRHEAPVGTYVDICVADNGCGIEEENLAKVMEPFFTTKEEGKGTGLGLAMIYGVVQEHHGYIDIKSQPGEGTAIHLFLPLTDQGCCQSQQSTTTYPGNGETILLVDDQQEVRQTCRKVLEALGYDVLEAGDGNEALDIYARHDNMISIVISDVVMPGMQGLELAWRIKQCNQRMPVILISGYDKNEVLDDSVYGIVDQVVTKPFSVEAISSLLYQLLHA